MIPKIQNDGEKEGELFNNALMNYEINYFPCHPALDAESRPLSFFTKKTRIPALVRMIMGDSFVI
jgi:hypothetical protein